MQLPPYLLCLSSTAVISAAFIPFPLTERAVGQSCDTPHGVGSCQNTADCTTQGFNLANYCPGAADIQCCVKKSCDTPSGSGVCINTSEKDQCGGSMVAGFCPGDNTIQCCVSGSTTPAPPPPPKDDGSGQPLVDAAVTQKGLPYVWGGGGCAGPSKGGFDCSGLTQHAACKALDVTIPRTAQTQYHSSLGKHIPRADAQAGDMIFWATGGDCKNHVAHVGIFMGEGKMVNAAHTGTPVKEQNIWISSGGESICPDAVRFW